VGELRIIHVDMDAFFASVEQRDHPEYRGRPVVVGGRPEQRGVVATASYEARRYGIHSAMASREAVKRCPQVIFLPTDIDRYRRVSRQIHAVFRRYTEIIEPISLDEAFLDVTGQDAVAVGKEIKAKIRAETELTASVGVSYNKFLAKLASDMEKPDGFTVITAAKANTLLPPLPIRKLWGVGPRTEEELNRIGIATFADLLKADVALLHSLFGKRGEEMLRLARGVDDRPVEANQVVKSLGEETTFDRDISDRSMLQSCLDEFAGAIARRLGRSGLKVRTVTLKLRYEDFTTITRSRTIDFATDSREIISRLGGDLLAKIDLSEKRARLLGLTVSNFLYPGEPEQLHFSFIASEEAATQAGGRED
jgi:DNA polymerase-4